MWWPSGARRAVWASGELRRSGDGRMVEFCAACPPRCSSDGESECSNRYIERPSRKYFGCRAYVGILLMISGATEGFPYTSIHIRDELAQDIVAFIGLFLAIFGTYYGFSLGTTKKRWVIHAPPLGPTGLKDQKR